MRPVYIITGFLESGKTEFINFTLGQPYFQVKGKTLLIDEWGEDGPVQHTFIWDGMKPVYSKTAPLKLDD